MTSLPTSSPDPAVSLTFSEGFAGWLRSTGASLAFTTYQAGKLFVVDSGPEGEKPTVFERSFERCMGLGVDPENARTLWLASLFQLWRFENFLMPGQNQDGFDAVYVPLEARTTGEIDIHDICPRKSAPPMFVATRFNCLATLDHDTSFKPIWKPPFITEITGEDRCHLNGLAMNDGTPAYVTCISDSNTKRGWHEARRDGGLLIDVTTNETVLGSLSMPHSPRLHQGNLYLLQSGTGDFGRVDLDRATFEPICILPGFARGLAFFDKHAIIGVSKPREDGAFGDLPLGDRLTQSGTEPRCMIAIVNLETGAIDHSLILDGIISELYDVAVLNGVKRGQLIGVEKPDIRYMVKPAPMDGSV